MTDEELVEALAYTIAAYFGENDTPVDAARACLPIIEAHQSAAIADAVEAERERCAKVADYAVERSERDWRNPDKQDAVKQVGQEIAEVIRYGPIRSNDHAG